MGSVDYEEEQKSPQLEHKAGGGRAVMEEAMKAVTLGELKLLRLEIPACEYLESSETAE